MANNTQAVFNATAAGYDRDRMKLIPEHESFYATALDLIPQGCRRIVELGAGSGLFSQMLAATFPAAELTLVDFSEPMLARARERLGFDDRLSFLLADYSAMPLPAPVDAVVSALSIHHLEDDRKRALFSNIFAALAPGGVFVNADQILAPTAALEAEARTQWLADVRHAGATEQQIADSLLRQQEDRCATVDAQLDWMRAAGFASVACAFQQGRFAVMHGARR